MGNIDSRPVCATHERFATISALDSNIAHRTSDFEFFSKLLEQRAERAVEEHGVVESYGTSRQAPI